MTCRSLVALTLLALSGLGSGPPAVGRAWEERRRPDGPDLPLRDTVVTLVPRSEAFFHRLEGYATVTVWLRQISVGSGARELVELTDRSAWFSGVLESLAPGAGR